MCRSFVVRAEARELVAIVRALRSAAVRLVRVSCELVAARVLEGAGNAGRGWL